MKIKNLQIMTSHFLSPQFCTCLFILHIPYSNSNTNLMVSLQWQLPAQDNDARWPFSSILSVPKFITLCVTKAYKKTPSSGMWRHTVWYLSTKLCGITPQMTAIITVTTMRTSTPIKCHMMTKCDCVTSVFLNHNIINGVL